MTGWQDTWLVYVFSVFCPCLLHICFILASLMTYRSKLKMQKNMVIYRSKYEAIAKEVSMKCKKASEKLVILGVSWV
jgi:hypothetical protein